MGRPRQLWKGEKEKRVTDWKTLEAAKDLACFRAELAKISPESYSLEEKKQILEGLPAPLPTPQASRTGSGIRYRPMGR